MIMLARGQHHCLFVILQLRRVVKKKKVRNAPLLAVFAMNNAQGTSPVIYV